MTDTEHVPWRRQRAPDAARVLRSLAGVDEPLLYEVRHERARHTALGGVVLGTALIAGFSMWIALNQALGAVSWWTLVPAAIWFLFVLNLDRLLVSSMAGSARRIGPLLMRIGVATMFGFIIAEPLVMRIFETAIEEHIRDGRTQSIADLRTRLLDCNGETDATDADTAVRPDCAGYVLTFASTPAAIRKELADSQAREQALQKVVHEETATLNALRENANKECGGAAGAGFTGRRGFGPYCDQRIAVADEFAVTHQIAEKTHQLAALRARIAELQQSLGTAASRFEQERTEKIEQRLAEARSHQRRIGFLERLDALHDLSSSSFALFVATWAIRLFFIAIDCLPVIAKFYGGSSGYDDLFRIRSDSVRRIFAEDEKTRESEIIEQLEDRQDRAEQRTALRRAELDLQAQEHKAQMKMRLSDAVSRLAAQLHQPPRQRTGENGHDPRADGAMARDRWVP